MASSNYQVIARRYRPQTFSEVIGQKSIISQLFNEINEDRIGHGYLCCGPRGTGKTSTARIFAKALNCINGPTTSPCGECSHCQEIAAGNHLDVIEVDAATYTKADDTKSLLEGLGRAAFSARYKVYIIDEVHMLSTHSFNALLKSLEEPPSHVVFILATTNPEKIPDTVISRCRRLNFERIDSSDIEACLSAILEKEKITIPEEEKHSVLKAIALASEGGMRDAQVLLDQLISLSNGELTLEITRSLLGVVETDVFVQLLTHLVNRNVSESLELIASLVDHGRDLQRFIKMYLGFLRDVMLLKAGGAPHHIKLLDPKSPEVQTIINQCSLPFLLNVVQQFITLEEKLRGAVPPRFLIEFTLIKLTAIDPTMLLDPSLSGGGSQPSTAGSSSPASTANSGSRSAQPQAHRMAAAPMLNESSPRLNNAEVELPVREMIQPIHTNDEDRWKAFQEKATQEIMILKGMISESTEYSVDNNALTIMLPASERAMVPQLDQPHRLKPLRKIARDIFGKPLMVQFLVNEETVTVAQESTSEFDQPYEEFEEILPVVPEAYSQSSQDMAPQSAVIEEVPLAQDNPDQPLTKPISFQEALEQFPDFKQACDLIKKHFGADPVQFQGMPLSNS